ncbi:MAG: glycosyltransferase [Opitutaceae bacterium]|nr:glycosyltransferase [Opitutaceae bacterium]
MKTTRTRPRLVRKAAGGDPATRSRRIAMISTHGYVAAVPPLGAADTGGQVVYVLELSKKFAALGYEVDIWTRKFADQPETEEVAPGVVLRRVPCGGPEFVRKEDMHRFIPEWCENALRLIREEALVYSFINSHYWDAGLAGQHLADVLDVPHIHTPHSLGSWKKKQMTEGASAADLAGYNFDMRIREETALYAAADMVIATTPEQIDILAADYDVPTEERVKMVPPGYDDARFFPVSESTRQSIRRRLGFRGPTVLALGRLARNKGYDLLVRAFAVMAKRVPAARLHLAMGGENLNEREQSIFAELKAIVAELELGEKVTFGSFIPDAELADYYRAADEFVLCSRYEPFGMTAIEAMASGCPTVVTVHGGLYRALSFGRHALYADPFDAEDLGITMMKAFKHPRLRARLARMGAHKARSLFTWTGIAQQLVALAEARTTPAFSLVDNEWDEPWNDND